MKPLVPFSDPEMVGSYAEVAPQRVPGLADPHRMVLILLSERAADGADILVLGAGGGLEIKAIAAARPDWSFVGIDPSRPMLDLAAKVLGPLGSRVQWVHGYVEDAPARAFDGATCLLTLHFLPRAERLRVLCALRARLKPGAPLVVAHHSCVQAGQAERWLTRSVAFADGVQADFAQAAAAASGMARHLDLLSATEEEELLRDAGFDDPTLFYAGLSFRGWVAAAGAASGP